MNNMYDILGKMRLMEGKGSKPDFLDLDKDGNKTEPMKDAAKEVDEGSTGDYSAKKARAGKDIGKPGKNFEKIAKSAGERYGSKERGEKVAGAVLAKLRANEGETMPKDDPRDNLDSLDPQHPANRGMGRDLKTKIQKRTGQDVYGKGRATAGMPAIHDYANKPHLPEEDVAEGNDGNLANNAKPYDRVTRGDVIAGRLGKDAMGGKAKSVKEGFNSDSLEAILDQHSKDIEKFKATGELSDSLYDALYGEWMSEMPYGTAKARDGDPYEWIANNLEQVLDNAMDEALDINLLKAMQKHASDKPQQKDPESERNIHKKYGYRSDRDDSDEDDYDEWGNLKPGARKKAAAHVVPGEKRGRGRPKGSGRAIGAKGPTGKSKLLAREDMEECDDPEYGQEGDMAKDDLKSIAMAAKELHSILGDNDDLPEWVQAKITKALDYINTSNQYMHQEKSDVDTAEPMAEKAVSVAQRRAAGIAHAAQKGEIPRSELKGASREMAKMSKGELHKFAATKEKGLPEKKSKKKEESVEETTVAGSVATAPAEAPKGKKGMQFGKGVYENRLAENFDNKLKSVLTEGISMNISVGEDGKKNLSVNATDDDAIKLAQILKLAGMPQGHDYHDVCSACGSADCQCDEVNEAELANAPDPVYGSTDMIKAQGEDLHKPKSTGQTTIPVLNRDPARQGVMHEASDKESALWNLYKRIQ